MEELNSNFRFLEGLDPRLSKLGKQAECYVHSDPEACLFKLRLMVEMMASTLARITLGNALPPELGVTLGELERTGVLPRSEADQMHAIRRDGNSAVHGGVSPPSTALRRLRDAYALSHWYSRSMTHDAQQLADPFHSPKTIAADNVVNPQVAAAETLEDQIAQRRRRTRQALMLFSDEHERQILSARYRSELEGLDAVAATAGESDIDAESMAIIMALELEQLLEHPTFGRASRDARREAEAQLAAVKRRLDDQESLFREARERLTTENF